MRRLRALALAAGAGVALTLAAPARADIAAVVHDAPLEGMFATYGDSGAGWSGGDSTYSVVLPDGRTVWVFSDTFLGPVNPDGSRPMTAPFIHNSYVLQSAGSLTSTLYTTNAFGKFGLVNTTDGQTYYWMGAPLVENGRLLQFVNRFVAAGGAFQQVGVDIATFSLPDLTLQGITPSPGGFLPTWQGSGPVDYGQAVLQDGGYDYVYGVEDYPLNKFLHVARVPAGHLLDGTWEYYTGHTWTTTEALSWRQLSEVADELSVVRTGHGYRLVAQQLGIGTAIQMYNADNPQFDSAAGPVTLYSTPETGAAMTTYNAKEHPELDAPDHIVVSYNVNSATANPNGDYNDVTIYRPRFVDIPIPSDIVTGSQPTAVAWGGATRFLHGSASVLSGTLRTPSGLAIFDHEVTLTLGSGTSAVSCTAMTDGGGTASCTVPVSAPEGPTTGTVSFAGDSVDAPSSASVRVLVRGSDGG